MKRLSVSAAAAAAFALWNRSAAAEPVSLRYVSDAACPAADAFEVMVEARTHRARFAPYGSREFEVTLARQGDTWTGALRVARKGDARASVRYLEGGSCAEAADALALVVALAIDPNASTAPAAPELASPPRGSPAPLPSDAPAVPQPEERSAPTIPRSGLDARRHRPAAIPLRVGADVTVASALTSAPLTGGGIFGELAAGEAPGAASLGLSFSFASSSPFDGASPSARYLLAVARLSLCPPGLAPGFGLSVRGCASIGAGLARGVGIEIAHPSDAEVPWVEATATAILRWESGRVFVDAGGGILVPITRPTFVFQTPLVVVDEVPAFGPIVSLAIGTRIW